MLERWHLLQEVMLSAPQFFSTHVLALTKSWQIVWLGEAVTKGGGTENKLLPTTVALFEWTQIYLYP